MAQAVRGLLVASAIVAFLTARPLAAQSPPPILHQTPAVSDAPAPEAWGSDILTLYRIAAGGFAPISSATSYVPFNGGRKCLTVNPSCFFEAALPLPGGVRINRITLEGCDNDAAGEYLHLSLFRCAGAVGACTIEATATTSGVSPAPGCGYVTSPSLNLTLDNNNNTYYLQIQITGTSVEFRSATAWYFLQVSPPPAVAGFTDVPVGHPQFQFIEALRASGITVGCGGGQFCPDAPITRGQMAVFLAKALGLYWSN